MVAPAPFLHAWSSSPEESVWVDRLVDSSNPRLVEWSKAKIRLPTSERLWLRI